MLASVRLGEKSAAACAVTTWRDQLYLAWTGTDMHINVASSADGREITGKQRLAEVSCKRVTKSSSGPNQSSTTETVALAPALAGSGARLCLAWRGSDGALNVLGAEHPDYPRPVTFKERTAESPSLTTTEPGDLAVAWTGTDRHVNLLTVAEDPPGAPGGAKSRFEEAKSDNAPAVCRHEGRLVLAWTGSDRRINLLTVADHGSGAPVRLEEARSYGAPALCSHQGRLILAWTGSDRRINLLTVADHGSGAPVRLEEARSYGAPALCSHQGRLVLAWTGSDRRINLASVQ